MRCVRNIRSFRPELDAELFADLELTEEPDIEVNRAGAAKDVAA